MAPSLALARASSAAFAFLLALVVSPELIAQQSASITKAPAAPASAQPSGKNPPATPAKPASQPCPPVGGAPTLENAARFYYCDNRAEYYRIMKVFAAAGNT